MLIDQSEIAQWKDQGIDVIHFEYGFAGGISTLESGFVIAWVLNEDLPIVCFLQNRQGEAFARFDKDKTVRLSHDGATLSRAENEAVIGMKKLVLKWD